MLSLKRSFRLLCIGAVIGACQDKLPELVVLTAASAKLVAGVFIRAGESVGGALANDNPFRPLRTA